MERLTSSIMLVFSRKDSRLVIIVATLFFFLILLLIQNGKGALAIAQFDSIPFGKRMLLSVSTLTDVRSTMNAGTLILAILGSFLGGINISLAYIYMRLRGEVILHSGLYSGFGLFVAFLGIGCAACGTAFLSVILGFFGLSAMLSILPYDGMEIGYIGLIILLIATYSLSQKVSAPNVC